MQQGSFSTKRFGGSRSNGSRNNSFPDHHSQQSSNRGQRKNHTGNVACNPKVINRLVTKAAQDGDLAALLQVVATNLNAMNGINLATSFHRVAKLAGGQSDSIQRDPMFQQLLAAVVRHIADHSLLKGGQPSSDEMPVQCLSIVSWSCATLRLKLDAMLSSIADIASPRLGELQPFELANLMWAYAKLSVNHAELFKAAANRVLSRQFQEFRVQCLSTIAWAFATVDRRHQALLQSIGAELASRAREVKPQEIANVLWAFARCRCPRRELFQTLGSMVVAAERDLLRQFKPQEISNTVWAFATVGLNHPCMFADIEHEVLRRRNELPPQSVSNILWAFSKLGNGSPIFYHSMLQAAKGQLGRYKTAELSALVSAASKAAPQEVAFFGAVAKECTRRTKELPTNALANMLRAFSTVELPAGAAGVFSALAHESSRREHFEAPALFTLLQGALAATAHSVLKADSVSWEHMAMFSSEVCQRLASQPRLLSLDIYMELRILLDTHQNHSHPGISACMQRLKQALATIENTIGEHPDPGKSLGSCLATMDGRDDDDDDDHRSVAHTQASRAPKESQKSKSTGAPSSLASEAASSAASPRSAPQPEDAPWHIPLPQGYTGPAFSPPPGLEPAVVQLQWQHKSCTGPPGLTSFGQLPQASIPLMNPWLAQATA